MNWAGDLVQTEVDPSDSVLDLGCGIMQATMDFIAAYPKTRLKCGSLLGVDIHEPYLEYLKKKGIKTKKHDLTDLPLPFPDSSFDVVLIMDILEHLTEEEAEALTEEASRIARKKVIALTPSFFQENEEGTNPEGIYEGLGENTRQLHKSLISRSWLKQRGFKVNRIKVDVDYWFAVKRVQLKILHVWCQAGVGSLMATYQRKLGHVADLVKDRRFTALGIERFYGFNIPYQPSSQVQDQSIQRKAYSELPDSRLKKAIRYLYRKYVSFKFMLKVAWKAREYDIIHVHSMWLLLFLIPFKKKILELHGDDCRSSPSLQSNLKKRIVRSFIRLYSLFRTVYVSTPDMLYDLPTDNLEWIPNPVDPEHFARVASPEPNTALYIHNWYESGDHAEAISTILGLKLTVFNRAAPDYKWIPYADFPAFLSKFDYFIERKEIPSLSKTGLEALAMGLKVVCPWSGRILKGLPVHHLPSVVAKNTIRIYRSHANTLIL